ncbi:hypothetical protein QE152_g40616 [Popillia japonica]|uniref:Uncharacterized protein n=1 Tax=Popillia japonica TaxID=7064 RepID=A0AAW1HG96_POPJA
MKGRRLASGAARLTIPPPPNDPGDRSNTSDYSSRPTIVFIRNSVGGQMPEGMVPLGTVAGYQAAYKEEGSTVVVRFIRIESGSQ